MVAGRGFGGGDSGVLGGPFFTRAYVYLDIAKSKDWGYLCIWIGD